MCAKIFKPTTIGGATALIAVTSLLSYAIGLVRDRIIAVNFGTTSATDTYNASFLIPDMIFNLFIAGALAAAFLPIFTDYLSKDKNEAFKLANSILTGGTLLIAFLAVIAFVFMPQIVPFAFPEAEPSMHGDIVTMTRIMLSSALLFAISNTLGNILMSYKHFVAYAISPILYNGGIILGVIFLNDTLGIYSAAIGVLIGATLHCLIRIIDTVGVEYKFKPQLAVKTPGFKKIIKLMIPKSLSLIAWQINLYIYAVIGIKLVEGGLAAFHFARNIQSFAVSLFGVAFATAVFPYLADSVSNSDQKAYTEHMQKTIQRILFFTIPAAIGIMTLSRPLVELILSGGVFTENSVKITSLLLFFFALSVPFESISHILSRGFYALQNTITPTIINILSMLLIALLTIFVAPKYGIEWFAIGFTLSFIVYVLIMIVTLKDHLKGFDFKAFLISLMKIFIASGVMTIVILVSQPLEYIISIKLAHALRIVLGGFSFLLVATLVKSSEIGSIKYILDRLLKKSA